MEKEREARKKAGLAEFGEEKISPRQQRLGAFVGLGKQIKMGEGGGQEEGNNTTAEEKEEEETKEEGRRQPAATARSPLQAKSSNAVVQSCMVAASDARKEIDWEGNDCLLLGDRVARKQLLLSVPAITPTKPHREPIIRVVEIVTTAQVDYTTELLGLISTQDLQSSDDDSSSSSNTSLADDKNHPRDVKKNDDNDEGSQEDRSDFADADFEELAQDLEFGSPPAVSELTHVLNQKEKPSQASFTKNEVRNFKMPQIRDPRGREEDNENDDSLFDKFAPLSQDLLDLVEVNDFDAFELSTQDIRLLDPP